MLSYHRNNRNLYVVFSKDGPKDDLEVLGHEKTCEGAYVKSDSDWGIGSLTLSLSERIISPIPISIIYHGMDSNNPKIDILMQLSFFEKLRISRRASQVWLDKVFHEVIFTESGQLCLEEMMNHQIILQYATRKGMEA
ncbi:hypothetical protein JW826_03245 [Candidatus Woesearchaeota archaeon]|nr:hypothetical protein [Candidatus Woesearchaeota archaeon]